MPYIYVPAYNISPSETWQCFGGVTGPWTEITPEAQD